MPLTITIKLDLQPTNAKEAQDVATGLVAIADMLRHVFPLPITGVEVVHDTSSFR